MVADIGTKPLKPTRFLDLNPLVGLKPMSGQARGYLRYVPEGLPWQNPDDAWYHGDGTRHTDPSDEGGEWLATPLPTPPTDEELAAVRRVAFEKDLEKVKQLVQIIAIFQSIEGAHAQAAEADEEKTYIHVVIYGVIICLELSLIVFFGGAPAQTRRNQEQTRSRFKTERIYRESRFRRNLRDPPYCSTADATTTCRSCSTSGIWRGSNWTDAR